MADDRPIGVDDRALDDAAIEALATACATPPPPALRARLLRDARRLAEIEQGSRRPVVVWRRVGTVAAALLVALGTLLAREVQLARSRGAELAQIAKERAALLVRLDEQGRMLIRLQESLAAQATVLRVLSGPRTVTAALSATESGSGSGRVVVDAESGEAAIVVSGLPPPPIGKAYELWAIRGDLPPEPAGVFTVGSEPATIARVSKVTRLGEVHAFAVSVEPVSGSRSPTGPIVLAGQVAG